jgi:hypothetical protein
MWQFGLVVGLAFGRLSDRTGQYWPITLAQGSDWPRALVYVGSSNAVGLIGLWCGASLARLWPA